MKRPERASVPQRAWESVVFIVSVINGASRGYILVRRKSSDRRCSDRDLFTAGQKMRSIDPYRNAVSEEESQCGFS
jgi:hypothetical protein